MDRRYKKKYEKKDLKNWELKHCIECGSKMKIRYGFTVTSPIMGDISYRWVLPNLSEMQNIQQTEGYV